MKTRLKKRILPVCLLAALVLAALGVGAYISGGYRADSVAAAALAGDGTVTVEEAGGRVVFLPEAPKAGFVFYPGGLVEHTAYAPLLSALAREGILCVLVEMPLDLAVLGVDAAEGIPEEYPQVDDWYIGGHSLGGAMAASHAAGHAEHYEGLVLLAAYSTADLTGSGLEVLSLYGSEDGVLDREKYEKYRANLPADAAETVIDGGCHAGFGSYGPQEGDGTPSITTAEQTAQTAAILAGAMLDG